MDDYSYLFKIILVGDANVGKTCLVRQFTKGYFPPNQGPTIGVDFTIKTVDVDGEKVKVRETIIVCYLQICIGHVSLCFASEGGRRAPLKCY